MSRRVLIAALVAAIYFCLPSVGQAEPGIDRLERQSAEAAERIESLAGRLGRDRADFDRASERATSAAERQSELDARIRAGAERGAVLDRRLDRGKRSLDRIRDRLRRAERLLSQRLVSIYMAGPAQTTDLLLSSRDFGELAARSEYFDSIGDAGQRLAQRVRSVRGSLEAEVGQLTSLRAEAETQLAELESARDGIDAARSRAEASAARLASVSASRRDEIEALRDGIERREKQIQKRRTATAAEAEAEVARQFGGPFSIPTYIVMCESGGNYSALNPSSGAGGAYQIIPSTWEAYGGEGLPHQASKAEQDRIAALIWANDGPGAWVCS